MSRTVILDFDDSVVPLPECEVIPLSRYQETIRFGCRMPELRDLGEELAPVLDTQPRLVFMGSGDYHHVSYLLIERLRTLGRKIQIIVFDNHPDNMRYPFGIHCGSWVWHVSRLPFVMRVHVVGITSTDVNAGHLWENHLGPLYSGKVMYWCVQRSLRAMRLVGIRRCRTFDSMADLLDELPAAVGDEPIYLSIDKDVLSGDVVQTNWDQGVMTRDELTSAIQLLQERIIGSDICGEVSSYRYRSRFKRFLSNLDHQPAIAKDTVAEWQARHRELNLHLLSLLS